MGNEADMSNRKASIKETGEELSQEEWARFDAAADAVRAERSRRDEAERQETATPEQQPIRR